MTLRSGHWAAFEVDDTPDRVYAMEDRAKALGPAVGYTGIAVGYGDWFTVTAQSADPGTIRYRVGTGYAMARGFWAEEDDHGLVDLDAPNASPRIDLLVLRFQFNGRDAEYVPIKGTPATNPVAPSRTETSNVLDLPIAELRVNPADNGSSSGRITLVRQQYPLLQFGSAPIASPNFSGTPAVGGQPVWHRGNQERSQVEVFGRNWPTQGSPTDDFTASGSGYSNIFTMTDSPVPVPSWAARCVVEATIHGLRLAGNGPATLACYAQMADVGIADRVTRIIRATFSVDDVRNPPLTVQSSSRMSIPTSVRGSSRHVRMLANRESASGFWRRDQWTTATGKVTFFEA